MANFSDLRGLIAEEVAKLHADLDAVHQRFHVFADQVAQEAISQVAAGHNPFSGQPLVAPPAGHVQQAPVSEQSVPSDSVPAQSASSSGSTAKDSTSDAGSSGTSQPK